MPFPLLGDLPDPRTELESPLSPALAGRFFTAEPPGKPIFPILTAAFCCLPLSYGYKKSCYFFNVFSFLLVVRTEWGLPNFLHLEPENGRLLYA